jgi:polyhydroxyalkanoate synthesis regulator protein
MFPFGQFEEMNKQNIALFEQTMKMFSPFMQDENGEPVGDGLKKPAAPGAAKSDASLDELKSQLEAMQAQLNSLAGGKSDK